MVELVVELVVWRCYADRISTHTLSSSSSSLGISSDDRKFRGASDYNLRGCSCTTNHLPGCGDCWFSIIADIRVVWSRVVWHLCGNFTATLAINCGAIDKNGAFSRRRRNLIGWVLCWRRQELDGSGSRSIARVTEVTAAAADAQHPVTWERELHCSDQNHHQGNPRKRSKGETTRRNKREMMKFFTNLISISLSLWEIPKRIQF